MMPVKQTTFKQLHETVQFNCHVADASHAGDYTLCIYLLKMREFYRWEQQASLSTSLNSEHIGLWLKQRENLWESLEEDEFSPLLINDEAYDPFNSNEINRLINDDQLVYSAGYGLNNRPHFFLADLEQHEQHGGYELYIAGKEHARDMSAPPAMSIDNKIYIRKESFRRLLWEKLETWRWNRPDNALGRAFACYDCENDLDQALLQMSDAEVRNVIEHEKGEIEAGKLLGPGWEELLYELPYSKASIMLRAIRDHLADALTTLPALLQLDHPASWHFYFGNLNNMRKSLFPALNAAYENWVKTGSLQELKLAIEKSKYHWLTLCEEILNHGEPELKTKQQFIQDLIENRHL